MSTTFDYVPTMATSCRLAVVTLQGIATIHGSANTSRGWLYGRLVQAGGSYVLSLCSSPSRHASTAVASGTVDATGKYFDLSEDGDSGVSGQAMIQSFDGDDLTIVAIPTFAVDKDVYVAEADAARLPGYDEDDGLAEHHAAAMRTILSEALPSCVPHLFPKGSGLASYVPGGPGDAFPDLRKLANADQLRIAQGHLVRAIACEQMEHVEEYAAIAVSARKRFDEAMARLQAGNAPADEAAAADLTSQSSPGLSVGTWSRV